MSRRLWTCSSSWPAPPAAATSPRSSSAINWGVPSDILIANQFRIVGRSKRPISRYHFHGFAGGAQGRDRTTDTVIFSHVLYQLSYLGMSAGKRKQRL